MSVLKKAKEPEKRRSALIAPVEGLVAELAANPGEWFVVGDAPVASRQRAHNAAARLRSGRYAALRNMAGSIEATVETYDGISVIIARYVYKEER